MDRERVKYPKRVVLDSRLLRESAKILGEQKGEKTLEGVLMGDFIEGIDDLDAEMLVALVLGRLLFVENWVDVEHAETAGEDVEDDARVLGKTVGGEGLLWTDGFEDSVEHVNKDVAELEVERFHEVVVNGKEDWGENGWDKVERLAIDRHLYLSFE